MSDTCICPEVEEITCDASTCATCFSHTCSLCDGAVRHDAAGDRICAECWTKLSDECAGYFDRRVADGNGGRVYAQEAKDPAPSPVLVLGGQGRTAADVERASLGWCAAVLSIVAVLLFAALIAAVRG